MLKTPKNWRRGQTIFNFLEWVATQGYPTEQSSRMADIFHIQDETLDKLEKEYNKLYEL